VVEEDDEAEKLEAEYEEEDDSGLAIAVLFGAIFIVPTVEGSAKSL